MNEGWAIRPFWLRLLAKLDLLPHIALAHEGTPAVHECRSKGYRMLHPLVTPVPQEYEVNGSFCSMEPCGCLWTLPVPPEPITS